MKMNHWIVLALIFGIALALPQSAWAQALTGETLTLNRGGGNGGLVILEADGFPTRYMDNRQGHIRFWSPGRVDMTIRGSGKIGINNSNPQTVLHVSGDTTSGSFIVDNGSAAGGFFEFRSAGNTPHFLSNVNGSLRLTNGTIEELLIDGATGNATFANEVSAAVIEIRGAGNDLAEGFKVNSESVEVKPGMVVAISPDKPGEMELSTKPYQRTVAGIISGAGDKHVGLQLGNAEEVARGELTPVALTGQVWCHVDTTTAAIQPGDLLTTSATVGHAMKVSDHVKAQGAIIGKAMTALPKGQRGLVLVLVTLQ